MVAQRSGVVHGPGNLAQNAIQFACGKWSFKWNGETAIIAIRDDGPVFPGALLERLEEP